jgi:hypothetical protein
MNHTCQYCSYESPVEARFCRQCGAQFVAETESSGASTRNYGRQESSPSVASAGSSRLPPSVAEVVAGGTERYYQSAYRPTPVITATAPIKTMKQPWPWTLFFFLILFGVAVGSITVGAVMSRKRFPVPQIDYAANRARRDAQRDADNQRRDLENQQRDAQNRARDAERRAQDAMNRAREANERAVEAGAALAPTSDKLIDLSHYEYPGATVSNAIRIAGREMLAMRTTDSFDTVNQFYTKKIGNPIIVVNEQWQQKLIFQSNSNPPIAISVESVPGASGPELKITVLRSPFRTLKPFAPATSEDEP